MQILEEHAQKHPATADFADDDNTEDSWVRLADIAETRSSREAVRRAGLKLREEGHVEVSYVRAKGRRGERNSGQFALAFRLAVAETDREELDRLSQCWEKARWQRLGHMIAAMKL